SKPSVTRPSPLTASMRSVVQPWGLPATSSLRCMIVAIPDGESRTARLSSHWGSATTLEPRDCVASREYCSSMEARARPTLGLADRAGIKLNAAAAIASTSAPMPPKRSTDPCILDIHLNYSVHPQRSNHDHGRGAEEHDLAQSCRVERAHVRRAADEQPCS